METATGAEGFTRFEYVKPSSAAFDMPPAVPNPPPPVVPEAPESGAIAGRAASGVLLLSMRGLLIRAVGLGTSIVLARLLTPRQFGLVALAAAIVSFGDLLGNAGIGAALVQRQEEPEVEDLRAVVALQVGISSAATAIAAIIGLLSTTTLVLAAIMAASLPIAAFRVPGAILLTRSLSFRTLARVEVIEFLVYSTWAIGTVAAGWNVWGLASAVVVRSVVGTALTVRAATCGFIAPKWSWNRTRSLLGFGLRYQAVGAVGLIRDQLLNVGVAAVGGLATLGLWDLGVSMLQVPGFLYDSLWRVSFPAMARLRDAAADLRAVIERTISMVAVVAGFLVSALVGSAPVLVSAVFGIRWHDVIFALPGAGFGLLVGGPISVAGAGYLFAVGQERVVLRSAMVSTTVLLLIALPLLPLAGLWAIGAGFMASLLVQAWILGRAVHRITGARMLAPMAPQLFLAVTAGALTWTIAQQMAATLESAGISLLIAAVAYLGPLAILGRDHLNDVIRVTRRAIVTMRIDDRALARDSA